MQYSMLRLFLTKRDFGPVIETTGDFIDQSRKEYLIECFSEKIEFTGRSDAKYVYAYVGTEGDVILGRIGRKRTGTETLGPETAFSEEATESWHAANILVDVSGESEGQKVAFEEAAGVGTPLPVLNGLIAHINEFNFRAKWYIDANTMTDSTEFWATVEENRGRISSLTMTFIAPNIFKSSDETSKALKELHGENGAQSTTIKIENRDKNLDPDSDRIRDHVEYIRKGGGSFQMRSGKKMLYNSNKMPRRVVIEEEELRFDISTENQNIWSKLKGKIFKK